MLTRDDLTALRGIEVQPAVSIFMPTQLGPDARENPVRLKNLLRTAEEQLIAQGLARTAVEALLGRATALTEDQGFWQERDQGLALFLAPGFHRTYHVPIEVPEKVVSAGHFHLKPLLPLLAASGGFWVLTLSADRAKLFRGSKFAFREIVEIGIPQSEEPVSRPRIDGVESRSKSESSDEIRQASMVNFMKHIEAAMQDRLSRQSAPLVLAATSQVQGHFRPQTKLPGLLDKGLQINPDALEPAELHRQAWEIVEPILDQDRQRALDHFNSLVDDLGTHNRTSMKVEEVIQAAAAARVDELLIAEGVELWGRYDRAKGHVEAHGHEVPGDQDLIDVAAFEALTTGGSVHLFPRDNMPRKSVIAATFRYEVPPPPG